MFLSIRADSGGDRSPWGNFWFSQVPFRGTAASVDSDSAMRLTAVYACVRIIAEDVAKLPFTMMRPRAGGGRDQVRDHWLYRLFARRPNEFQNPFEFREMMQGHLELRGNAYAKIVGNGRGEVTDLIPIHPDRVTIEPLNDGNWRYRVKNGSGADTPLVRGEVFHLRGLSLDGIQGVSPIAAARESVALGLAAQSYGQRFFANDARPGGWIEYPGNFKDAEARNLFREAYQSMQSGENRGKVSVLEYGMKFHEVAVTNEDSQFLETRQMQIGEIARLFRVPPHKIGDLSKATFSNIEQQSIEYVTDSLTPRLVRWEEAIEYSFLGDEADVELDVEFPVRSLLRGDTAARSTYYSSGINAGWLTRNEARDDDGRNPLDGLDEPLVPLNMVEEDNLEAREAAGGPPAMAPTEPAETVDPDARAHALASAAADRVLRKEAAAADAPLADGKHAAFVAQVLSIPAAAAAQYCAWRLENRQSDAALPLLVALARTGDWK